MPLNCNDADFRLRWRQAPVRVLGIKARPNRALLSAGSGDRKRAQAQVLTPLPSARHGQHTFVGRLITLEVLTDGLDDPEVLGP